MNNEGSGSLKQVFLHFDVNKTIIMTDIASGQTLEESLQNILAEEVKGTSNLESWILDAESGEETYADYTRRVYDKEEAKQRRMRFCEKGEPGHCMLDRMRAMEAKVAKTYFVPSFGRAIQWLKQHESKLNWRIYFRTFGTDGPDVVHHWNLMCEDLGLDASHRILEESVGSWERTDTETVLRFPGRTLSGLLEISEHIHRNPSNLALREHYEYW